MFYKWGLRKINKKELLFSVGPKDFKWEFYRSSGPGGQNKNKRDTACRCIHVESGAIGIATEEREQRKNRILAWKRCTESEKFKTWFKLECSKRMITSDMKKRIEEKIDLELENEKNLKVEVKDNFNNWVELEENKNNEEI